MLTWSADSFQSARSERLKVSGKPDQYDDLSAFVEEQALIRRLAARSLLPRIEIDISDNNVLRAAEAIADWLEATGGLWMN